MIKKLYRKVRDKFSKGTSMQTLLDKGSIKVQKTAEVEADDYDNKLSWWYRFTFANEGIKRNFLKTIAVYPEQEWDEWVSWWDDYSNLNGEICVEAKILVPPEHVKKFRERFKTFYTQMVMKG
jgi:hypothetical protein